MTALLTDTQRENQDTRLIPLSALQHYAFCPRQCALIHNEQAWAENYLTAQGKELHERVDSGKPETRKGVHFERTVHVSAEKLGVSGVLDLVEVETKTGRLKPTEYKLGKPKPDPMDEIQLCAQGLCLEEMTEQTVSEGTLWYMQPRHRVPIVFSDDLTPKHLPSSPLCVNSWTAEKLRRLTTANAAKPAHWWKFASRNCWGNEMGVWGMLRGYLVNAFDLLVFLGEYMKIFFVIVWLLLAFITNIFDKSFLGFNPNSWSMIFGALSLLFGASYIRDRFVKNNISANLNGDNIQNIQNSGKINGNININQINKKD